MAKTISVDELTYSNVVTVAGKMMMMFGKPFSLGFTIYIATHIFDKMLERLPPEKIKEGKELFKNVSSSNQLDEMLENAFRDIVGEKS